MAERSKSTLFLMEQLVVIAVFALCAAVCVFILAASFLMTTDSIATRNALLKAESVAESYKAFNGDAGSVSALLDTSSGRLSGQVSGNVMTIYYDENWQPTGDSPYFILRLESNVTGSTPLVSLADISVTRLNTGVELVNLTVGVRRAA